MTTTTDRKTNGRDRALVRKLEERTRAAITAAYKAGDAPELRDFAEDISQCDKWQDLIAREERDEREHRRFGASFTRGAATYAIPVAHAALLLVLHNIGKGAERAEPIPADWFLQYRENAIRAQVIGYAARAFITPELRAALAALDYAAAVK